MQVDIAVSELLSTVNVQPGSISVRDHEFPVWWNSKLPPVSGTSTCLHPVPQEDTTHVPKNRPGVDVSGSVSV